MAKNGFGGNAAESGSVTLTDPGYPEQDLTQIGYQFFIGCGLTYVAFGPGSLDDLFADVRAAAPAFNTTRAIGIGLASLGGREDSVWLGFEGPNGSVIAYYVFPDSDSGFVMEQVGMPLSHLPARWHWGIATLNASVPAGAAAILQTAKAVRVWDIRGLESLAPTESSGTPMPELLASRLVGEGWEAVDGTVFKTVVPGSDGRTQLLFFGVWGPTAFALMSPVAGTDDGTVPARLRGKEFGDYKIDVVGDMVVLVDLLPYGPPSPSLDEIHQHGRVLGVYADRVEADLSLDDQY